MCDVCNLVEYGWPVSAIYPPTIKNYLYKHSIGWKFSSETCPNFCLVTKNDQIYVNDRKKFVFYLIPYCIKGKCLITLILIKTIKDSSKSSSAEDDMEFESCGIQ